MFLMAFIITFLFTPLLIKKLKERGIVGKDMHKPDKPEVADSGGLAVILGVVVAILIAIAHSTFIGNGLDLVPLMAGIITLLIIEFIGIYDDLFKIPQAVKAFLPMLAAIPLMAIAAGTTTMGIPFLGVIDFGIFYAVLLIPLGITVTSNLTNMLAGFNGSEVGIGIVIFFVMSLLFFSAGKIEPLIICLAMLGALLGLLAFNWYPAKIFPGDATTFLIGGALATVVIIGDFESAGAILVIPHVFDFFIKAVNKFPKSFAIFKDGKLYAPEKPRGLADVLLKVFNGLTEVQLSVLLIGIQAFFGLIVLIMYF